MAMANAAECCNCMQHNYKYKLVNDQGLAAGIDTNRHAF